MLDHIFYLIPRGSLWDNLTLQFTVQISPVPIHSIYHLELLLHQRSASPKTDCIFYVEPLFILGGNQ